MARPRLRPGEWGEVSYGGKTTGGKVRARTRYCTPAGVIRSIEATGKTKAEATRKLRRRIEEWSPETGGNLFREVAGDWINEARDRGDLRAQSAQNYERVMRTTLGPALGSRAIGGITVPQLQKVLDDVHRDKPGQYAACITVARGAFSHAVLRGLIEINPAAHIVRRRTSDKEVRALELDELAGLRGQVREWQAGPRRTQPLLDVIDLALSTAARISELLAIRWEDVDLDARTLMVGSTQVWVKGKGIVHQDETKEGARLRIHLTDFAMEMLIARREADPGGEYVFASRTGGMIARSNLDRAWRAARGDIFEWVTWHTFRKSVATLAAEATDTATAAQVLGHTSDRVTRRHYIATNETAVPDITAVLEALAGEKVIHFDDEGIE